MSSGILYVLTNQAYIDDLVKIGWTSRSDLNIRLKELYTTGVPLPFECLRAVEFSDANVEKMEKLIHSMFDDYRLNHKREFFTICEEKVHSLFDLLSDMGARDITPEFSGKVDESASQTEKNISKVIKDNKVRRRNSIPFEEYGIPPGSTLVFKRDENIKVTTVDCKEKMVIYEGNVVILNRLTKQLKFGDPDDRRTVQAPNEWKYQGKVIDEIRKEKERGLITQTLSD
jgi:hypothetical protein